MANQSPASEVQRVGKFGLVGIVNTLIDLTLYNILSGPIGLPLIAANLCSTTVAMLFSFFANQRWVFGSKQRSTLAQAAVFFLITGFGLYGLQNGVIYLLTKLWTGPVDLGLAVAHAIGIGKVLSDGFLTKNGVKAAAIIVSLTWNYIMYKKVVFKK
jgi:putative flippase GtrA